MDALPPDLQPALRRRAEGAAAWLRERRSMGQTVTVVHHIDADGVSAAAIATACLERAGIRHLTFPAKSMDDSHVAQILSLKPDGQAMDGAHGTALWFCDLGSTVYMRFPGVPRLVCDHHQLVRDGSEESFAHLNPLLDGLSGEEISGAGCAYLAAAAFDATNVDLLPLALVGASGDLQDRKEGRFNGANAALVAHGCAAGLLDSAPDLAFFGAQTRPLRRFLAGASDPPIPGLSGAPRSVERLCRDAGVPLTDGAGAERTWATLDEAERRTLRSRLVDHLLDLGLAAQVPRLMRQVVTVRREPPGTALREPQESATLLNSTARYGRAEVGLAVARGDRDPKGAYGEALELLLGHRKHLAGALDAFARCGVTERTAVQWVHLEDKVLDTVVGIVCGMALDGLGLRRDLALLGFAWTPDGKTKVSSRSPYELQARGIDLASALREAAALFGGQGGGHKGAAGATIPRGCEAAFVDAVDRLVGEQIGVRVVTAPSPAPKAALVLPPAGVPAGPATSAVPAPAAPAFVLPTVGKQARLAF
ncbi:MAG TPA: DHH family phosphoesterase [Candidatus Thermoplasmatota archaeon]|nr:DHH family phosphoesterase [Candidatus Thermoplasmatota archaeon]